MENYYIITRPSDNAKELELKIASLGINTLIEPMIEIKFIQFKADFTSKSLIFTSQNAIASFAMQHKEREIKIFVLNGATYNIAKKLGFSNIKKIGKNIDELQKNLPQGEYIYISGDNITQELECERIIAYQSHYKNEFSYKFKELLLEKSIGYISFFSSNSAKTFLKLVKENQFENLLFTIEAHTISAKIANIVGQLKWKSIKVADSASNQAICTLLQESLE